MDKTYKMYHDTYSEAIHEVERYALSLGHQIDDREWHNEIDINTPQPKKDETARLSLNLYHTDKNGNLKALKEKFHVQIYCLGSKYELNCHVL